MELEMIETNSSKRHGQELLAMCPLNSRKVFLMDLGYLFLILLTSILFAVPSTIVPLHDSMNVSVSYWWEVPVLLFPL